jgi:hypothetical protein
VVADGYWLFKTILCCLFIWILQFWTGSKLRNWVIWRYSLWVIDWGFHTAILYIGEVALLTQLQHNLYRDPPLGLYKLWLT